MIDRKFDLVFLTEIPILDMMLLTWTVKVHRVSLSEIS